KQEHFFPSRHPSPAARLPKDSKKRVFLGGHFSLGSGDCSGTWPPPWAGFFRKRRKRISPPCAASLIRDRVREPPGGPLSAAHHLRCCAAHGMTAGRGRRTKTHTELTQLDFLTCALSGR